MFCSCSTILQLSAIFWQIFKFKFKRVTVLLWSETQQLGGTNPSQIQDVRSCFFGCLFYRFGFRWVVSCVIFQSVFCHSSTSPSDPLPRSRYLSPPVSCHVAARVSLKLRCPSCAVSHLSAFKHVCLLTCTAFDVPPCSS